MALSYHSGRRGFIGWLISLTGSDGVARSGVIPAFTPTSSAGVELGGGGDATAANQVIQSTKLDTLHTDLVAATPAGTNVIGGVSGPLANLSTAAANPFLLGARYLTTPPTYTNTQFGELGMSNNGGLRVSMGLRTAGADAYANNTAVGVLSSDGSNCLLIIAPHNFNGATWDRQRGDTNGAVNQPYALAPNRWTYPAAASGISNTTTAVTFIAAAGVGVRNYVTSIQLESGTLGAATEIAIRDGAAGTVLWRGKLETTALPLTTIPFPVPLKGTANTLMEVVTLTASVTGAVYFNAQGFQGT